jgi:DNA-binding CsgD family transcriptional regulator
MKARRSKKTPTPPSPPLILDFDRKSVQQVLGDIEIGQCWELLRASKQAYTAAQAALSLRVPPARAQHALDTLVEAGFIERVRAGRGIGSVTYRAIPREIMIGWDPGSPDHRQILTQLSATLRAVSRRAVDDCDAKPRRRAAQSVYLTFAAEHEDARSILAAITALGEQIRSANSRAERAKGEGPAAADATGPANPPEARMYHLSLDIREVDPDAAPLVPGFVIINREHVARLAADRATAPDSVLSPRELDIARLLAAGRSRVEIAESLGLGLNTILTHCKRIYAKLGIDKRADLTKRMRTVS